MFRLSSIPLNTLVQPHTTPTKAVQSTADCQINGSAAQPGYIVQVLEVPATARVGHGDAAPLGQLGDELLINPTLQALVIGSVDEELGAVGLQLPYGLYRERRGELGSGEQYVGADDKCVPNMCARRLP